MDVYLPLLTDIINDSFKRGIFPDEIKLAEVMPLLINTDPFGKTNCPTVSLLSHISKVFERVIYNQINEYIKPLLSKVLTGFCKNHITQHSLSKMLKNFKEALGNSNWVSATFIDLSKALNTLHHS